MAHKVTCIYCKKIFDRDKNPTKQVSARRYAHLDCWKEHQANMSQEEKDIEAFYDYTKNLFGEDYNYILTKKLAERYVKENNYTYSGMLKTLKWYYEKEGNSLDKSNGSIGIIPYIYKQALNYYYALYQAQLINKEKDISNFTIPKERNISIESPRVYVRPPHMWFKEEDNNE
jgi:hypothetical protein